MHLSKITAFLLTANLLLFPEYAQAYLGPGAGLGMIGSLIAVIVAVVIIILGLLIYPIRLLLKRKSSSKEN